MTAGHGEKLSRRQEAAIAALLLHPTLKAAAKAAGIGEKTLWRWLQDEGFRAAYQAARQEAVSQAIARLQHVAGDAVDTLRDVAADSEAPPAARVSAAKAILDLVIRRSEVEDLEQRIAALLAAHPHDTKQ